MIIVILNRYQLGWSHILFFGFYFQLLFEEFEVADNIVICTHGHLDTEFSLKHNKLSGITVTGFCIKLNDLELLAKSKYEAAVPNGLLLFNERCTISDIRLSHFRKRQIISIMFCRF
ncbi:MAG: hypothetical protein C0473_01625 [Cyanobacteria bacterium DS3.002]|nr:hypothetical protein [Cyanobacteria bacterium DS3.002]